MAKSHRSNAGDCRRDWQFLLVGADSASAIASPQQDWLRPKARTNEVIGMLRARPIRRKPSGHGVAAFNLGKQAHLSRTAMARALRFDSGECLRILDPRVAVHR